MLGTTDKRERDCVDCGDEVDLRLFGFLFVEETDGLDVSAGEIVSGEIESAPISTPSAITFSPLPFS